MPLLKTNNQTIKTKIKILSRLTCDIGIFESKPRRLNESKLTASLYHKSKGIPYKSIRKIELFSAMSDVEKKSVSLTIEPSDTLTYSDMDASSLIASILALTEPTCLTIQGKSEVTNSISAEKISDDLCQLEPMVQQKYLETVMSEIPRVEADLQDVRTEERIVVQESSGKFLELKQQSNSLKLLSKHWKSYQYKPELFDSKNSKKAVQQSGWGVASLLVSSDEEKFGPGNSLTFSCSEEFELKPGSVAFAKTAWAKTAEWVGRNLDIELLSFDSILILSPQIPIAANMISELRTDLFRSLTEEEFSKKTSVIRKHFLSGWNPQIQILKAISNTLESTLIINMENYPTYRVMVVME